MKTNAAALKAKKAANASKGDTRPPGAPNRSDFIRSLPVTMTAGEVVKKGAEAGLTFRTNLVYEVRRVMKKRQWGNSYKPPVNGARRGPGRPPSKSPAIGQVHGGHGPPRVASSGLDSYAGVERQFVGLVFELGFGRARELVDAVRGFGK